MLLYRRLPIGIFLCAFLDIASVSMVRIFMAKYLKSSLGLSHSSAGIIASLYGFTQVPSSPTVTSLAVKFGTLRIFQWCILLSGIFYFLLGLTDNIFVIAAVRICLGLTKHTQNLLKSELACLTTEISDEKESSRLFGFYQSMLSLGIVFGSTIGGYLMSYSGGYMIICTSTAVVYTVILGLTLTPLSPICKTHTSGAHKKSDDYNFNNSQTGLFSSAEGGISIIVLELLLLRFVLSFTGHAWRSSYVPLYTHMYEMDTIQIGQMVSYNAIVQLLIGFNISYINLIFKTSYIQSMTALIVTSIIYILITLHVPLPVLLVLIFLLSSSTMLIKISINQFSMYTLTHQQERTTHIPEHRTFSNGHQSLINTDSPNTSKSHEYTTLGASKSRSANSINIEEGEVRTNDGSDHLEKEMSIMTKFTGYAGSGDAIARLISPIFVGFMLDYLGLFSVLYLNVCLIGVAISLVTWLHYNNEHVKQKSE